MRKPSLVVLFVLTSSSIALAQPDAGPRDAGASDAAPMLPPLEDPAAKLPPVEDTAIPAPVAAPAAPAPVRITELTAVGTRERQPAVTAHVLRAKDLERAEHDDPHQVLRAVPGVHTRGEEGFGLRPNIGVRGVSPDRSKKVTLNEDGVLFGPAPYSAPAAYFFPLITRMESVRVIKGPGAITAGPQTVGGAIDLVTRRIPIGLAGGVDVGGGQYGYGKAHVHVGASNRRAGVLVEAVRLQSSGFKEIDGGGETGFHRHELMAKGRLVLGPGGSTFHAIEVKAGYSDEDSNETYLGLTDADFRANPLRRYRASKLDRMKWDRTQIELRHVLDFGQGTAVETVAYRHDMHRVWSKVNRFGDASVADVLRSPGDVRNAIYNGLLAGTRDTETPGQTLFIGPNRRKFVAQGVQSVFRLRRDGWLSHRFEAAVRLHYDHIDLRHSESPYDLRMGDPVPRAGASEVVNEDAKKQATALAVHAVDAISWRRLTLTPGVRVEVIDTAVIDRLPTAARREIHGALQTAIIPGLAAHYALTDQLRVLAGVHRGFAPAAPGSGDEVKAEASWNYEAGARLAGGHGRIEAIGFFNDYSNLISTCTAASGCVGQTMDQQFDARSAFVWGAELFAGTEWRLAPGWVIPATATYTYTGSRLRESFMSADPSLRNVEAGFEVPYLPRHQGTGMVGLETKWVGVDVAGSYVSRMREEAGRGSLATAFSTDTALVLDAGLRLHLARWAHVYVNARNLLGAEKIASRRPFGARPISPRWIYVGAKASF